jgi:hypothetical protein
MATDRSLGDRRAAVRFDLGGQVWGTVETMDPLTIRNVGRGGILVESLRPLRVDSIHHMHLVLHADESIVQARVRHVTGIRDALPRLRYLIGFEFIDVPGTTLEWIDELVAAGGRPGEPNGMN